MTARRSSRRQKKLATSAAEETEELQGLKSEPCATIPNMANASSTIVQKLWNYCNILRDDGLSYGDYVEQLTYLLFLKMAHEQTQPPSTSLRPSPRTTTGLACSNLTAFRWRSTTATCWKTSGSRVGCSE